MEPMGTYPEGFPTRDPEASQPLCQQSKASCRRRIYKSWNRHPGQPSILPDDTTADGLTRVARSDQCRSRLPARNAHEAGRVPAA